MSDATVGTYIGELPSMLARSRMKNEVAVIDESIRVLRSRRNALVPVSSLPPELLGAIFLLHFRNCRSEYHYDDRTKKSIAVTHVCQHWWSVAFTLPSLWNTPPVNLPHWFDEMVIRSKAAPLVLEVDCPSREVKFDQIAKHIPRTRALTVKLNTSIAVDCLVHLAGSAPLLEALDIIAPAHMPAHRRTVDLFGRDTPRLREVTLTHCNISWASPLLTGLTHLNIEQITTAARPTLYQVLSALALMPSLVALRLANALPIIQDDANPLPSYVTLPALSRLWLVGSVAECMGVLPRLDYPGNTAICLSCKDTVATGTGFAALLPFIYSSRSSSFWPDPGLRTLNFMLQPTPPAYYYSNNHNIDILCTTSDSIATQLIGVFGVPILDEYHWESARFQFPMLLLRFEGNGPHNANSILADACRILPINGVSRMVLKGLPTLSQSFWLNAFTKMASLRTLGICGHEAFPEIAGLVQALGKTHGGSLADLENLLPTVAPTFFAPNLETLGLDQVDFGDYAGVTRFAEFLARRSNQGMDLKRLEIVNCDNIGKRGINKIAKVFEGELEWELLNKRGRR